eukprot:GFKZ01011712.1.p1 GENE.GFKZ01011712.1~~GFKZ01011712.1.p1  ORF type:complete len:410 (+),score=46.06 GFKZ01011712.1:57-1286(+)
MVAAFHSHPCIHLYRPHRQVSLSRDKPTMTLTPVPDIPPRRIIKDNVYDGMPDAVGNTPLIRLQRASRETGCNIYGKAEFMNPGGSIKARAGLFLIKDAEKRGLLTPGKPGIIVEPTAGNTGISLAEVAAARGYKFVAVVPSSQSQEKKDAMRYAGAEVIEVPPVPYTNPNNYVRYGARLAKELGAVLAGQFENRANREGHRDSTGPEIWAQLDGKVDGFSCAAGTGGTISGVADYLRSVSDTVKIALTDPCGGKLVNYFNHGELRSEGESIAEGVGQVRVTGQLQGFTPDYAFEIPDTEAMKIVCDMMQEEGICLGPSSGINVGGAIRLAKELGPGHNIVTVLCDHGTRYSGKVFNVPFLREKGLSSPDWILGGLSEEVSAAVERTTVPAEIAMAEQEQNGVPAAPQS